MTTALVLLAVFTVMAFARWRNRDPLLLPPPPPTEALLRSGGSPAHCSWCKTITLGRKLFVFERQPPGATADGWRPVDVMAMLRSCPPPDVPFWAAALSHDQPRWRRLCSERCAREWIASEPGQREPSFVACAYCATRMPAELRSCHHCGAPAR